METLTRSEGLAFAVPALMVYCKVMHKRYPILAEVKVIDNDLAAEMGRLGYSEFTPGLLKAMILKDVDTLHLDIKRMDSKEIANFLRSNNGRDTNI